MGMRSSSSPQHDKQMALQQQRQGGLRACSSSHAETDLADQPLSLAVVRYIHPSINSFAARHGGTGQCQRKRSLSHSFSLSASKTHECRWEVSEESGVSACLQVKYFCNETGVECSVCRYHCVTMPDVDLSPAAYADGKFPPGCSSKDFVRIDQADFQVTSQLSVCNSSMHRGSEANCFSDAQVHGACFTSL